MRPVSESANYGFFFATGDFKDDVDDAVGRFADDRFDLALSASALTTVGVGGKTISAN